jgi:DMSO/TMAO reductase YedYZ molybdopterin-dependent catalytic subunit
MVLRIVAPGVGEIAVTHEELRGSELVNARTSDFHCVTTWTARQQIWTGVPLTAWWHACVAPSVARSSEFAIVRGYDGYQAVFRTDDLFSDDVMLAWELNHAVLDARHGFPLRLVSPSQY